MDDRCDDAVVFHNNLVACHIYYQNGSYKGNRLHQNAVPHDLYYGESTPELPPTSATSHIADTPNNGNGMKLFIYYEYYVQTWRYMRTRKSRKCVHEG